MKHEKKVFPHIKVVGCPVCGGEFSMREISKHSQSCYVRSERQTTYGTDYKVRFYFNILIPIPNILNSIRCPMISTVFTVMLTTKSTTLIANGFVMLVQNITRMNTT
jgi:hypothetical protein